jgi:membrane protease YdiL (CAAX protease family)
MTLTLETGWYRRVPGLFAQAGIAEEVLFRGYLFGHLRAGRSFWRAATVSTGPFVAVHLLLFLSMPWPVAAAAVALALVLSFPLAWLFELTGGTIWGPALVHFIIQGTIKVVVVSHDATLFALFWMCVSAAIPMLLFLARRPGAWRADAAIQAG